jgi:hypothetical protein
MKSPSEPPSPHLVAVLRACGRSPRPAPSGHTPISWARTGPGTWRAELDRSPLVELNPQEATALIHIATAGARAGTVSESDLSRLHLLGLVEQRGMAMGLTARGIRTVARLRRG